MSYEIDFWNCPLPGCYDACPSCPASGRLVDYDRFGFVIVDHNGGAICDDCIIKNDPQIINILEFIDCGTWDAQFEKLSWGMATLRKLISSTDYHATVCEVCGKRRQHHVHNRYVSPDAFRYCYHCQFRVKNGNQYSLDNTEGSCDLDTAKRIYALKAFQ